MRFEGTLKRWNDDKGFGFIAPSQGGADVFVHVSAFSRDGQRPVLNERLTFETERSADGRMKALRVQRADQVSLRAAAPVARPIPPRTSPRTPLQTRPSGGGQRTTLALLFAVVLVGAGACAYHRLMPGTAAVAATPPLMVSVPAPPSQIDAPAAVPARPDVSVRPAPVPAREPTPAPSASGRFACDGRTRCSQMTSCDESRYFLKHCPGVQMDGNGDGEPCEQQWCTR